MALVSQCSLSCLSPFLVLVVGLYPFHHGGATTSMATMTFALWQSRQPVVDNVELVVWGNFLLIILRQQYIPT